MVADSYGSILGLIQQGTGNNNNSWGVTFNNSFATPSERADAGVNTITATSGTVDLSTTVPPAGLRLDIDHIQLLTGALTADLTVKVPNVSKTWHWWNKTTGNFNVYVQVPGGVSPNGLVQIPQGCRMESFAMATAISFGMTEIRSAPPCITSALRLQPERSSATAPRRSGPSIQTCSTRSAPHGGRRTLAQCLRYSDDHQRLARRQRSAARERGRPDLHPLLMAQPTDIMWRGTGRIADMFHEFPVWQSMIEAAE